LLQGEPQFVGVVLQHGLEGLSRRLAEFLVNLGVPLVNPRQQLIEARQKRRQPSSVPSLPLAGVVIAHQRRRLLQMVPARPADHQRRVTFGLAVRVADPAFLRHVELASQTPVIEGREVGLSVLGWDWDRPPKLLPRLLLLLNVTTDETEHPLKITG